MSACSGTNWWTGMSSTVVMPVIDHRRMGQAAVGAPLLRRHARMAQRQTAHVRLIYDCLVVGDAWRPVIAPVEERVRHNVLRHVRPAVFPVQPRRMGEVVGEQGFVPAHLTLYRLGVRVKQQLGGVTAMPAARLVGSVHAVAVAGAWSHAGEETMPDETVDLGEFDARLRVLGVEQTQLDPLSGFGE